MCGILVDGDDTSGFRSALIAQFTGISLQKDMTCWQVYKKTKLGQITRNLNTTITSTKFLITFALILIVVTSTLEHETEPLFKRSRFLPSVRL